jgi:hypothetical protein
MREAHLGKEVDGQTGDHAVHRMQNGGGEEGTYRENEGKKVRSDFSFITSGFQQNLLLALPKTSRQRDVTIESQCASRVSEMGGPEKPETDLRNGPKAGLLCLS